MTRALSFSGFLGRLGASCAIALLVMMSADLITKRANSELGSGGFDDARGYQIFTSRCEVCHAKTESDLSRMGPSLARIGAVAANRRPGLNGAEYILESIMDPGAFVSPAASGAIMPANLVADLPDDDIRNLVAHVAAFGARPDTREIAALVVRRQESERNAKLEVRRDIVQLGERTFREKCQSCHSLHNGAEHLVFAPAVFGVGFPDEQLLRNAIKHDKRTVSERYRSSSVTLVDGSTLVGKVIERRPDQLLILSSRRENRGEISTVELADVRTDGDGEPMVVEVGLPPGLDQLVASLTPDEFESLVALLKAFN